MELSDSDARHRWLRAELSARLGTTDPHVMAFCLVLIVATLLEFERAGGIKAARIDHVTQTGREILPLLRLQPGWSDAILLERELELAASQANRRLGRHWLAAWQLGSVRGLQAASRARTRAPDPLAASIALAEANRLLRLGFTREALPRFAAALALRLEDKQRQQAEISRLMAWRLSGDGAAAAAAAAAISARGGLAARVAQELQWEEICRATQADGDLGTMLRVVRPRGTHRHGAYLAESYLWALAAREQRWRARLPKPSSMAQYDELAVRRTGFLFRCLETLERCHDPDVPIALRRAALGSVLERRHKLPTVDKELLLLAAAWRWLRRSKSPQTELVAAEYRALCARLSDGRDPDLLRLAR